MRKRLCIRQTHIERPVVRRKIALGSARALRAPANRVRVYAIASPTARKPLSRGVSTIVPNHTASRLSEQLNTERWVDWVVSKGTVASQFLSFCTQWVFRWNSSIAPQAAQQAAKASEVVEQLAKEERVAKQMRQPLDIAAYLKPVAYSETLYLRRMASISHAAYRMPRVAPERLARLFGMEFVAASTAEPALDCDFDSCSPSEIFNHGDGMAAIKPPRSRRPMASSSSSTTFGPSSTIAVMRMIERVKHMYNSRRGTESAAAIVAAQLSQAAAVAAIVAKSLNTALQNAQQNSRSRPVAPETVSVEDSQVASRQEDTYQLREEREAEHLGREMAQTVAGATSNIVPFARDTMRDSQQATHTATRSAGVISESMFNNAEAVESAAETLAAAARSQPPAQPVATAESCPVHWFVADDHATQTRYFVIQGSDNLDSWRTNLSFDPVVFEDASLGVKVHRGVYTVAKVLFNSFLPLVKEHLSASPFARIAFTGHSLGGSLGTLIMLMLKYHGVVSAHSLAPVYTFGAPAVLCEGARGSCSACCPGCSAQEHACMDACKVHESLLAKLGLGEGLVRNVIMARDIVPRAFSCDYSPVADVLSRCGRSFRDLACLQANKRKLLYSFIGQVVIMQPHTELKWVADNDGHPMLPAGAGIYMLSQPTKLSTLHAQSRRSTAEQHDLPTLQPQRGMPAPTLKAALLELMDNPHPLEILSDPSSYGGHGGISRHHNPKHYYQAASHLMKGKMKFWREMLQGKPVPSDHCSRLLDETVSHIVQSTLLELSLPVADRAAPSLDAAVLPAAAALISSSGHGSSHSTAVTTSQSNTGSDNGMTSKHHEGSSDVLVSHSADRTALQTAFTNGMDVSISAQLAANGRLPMKDGKPTLHHRRRIARVCNGSSKVKQPENVPHSPAISQRENVPAPHAADQGSSVQRIAQSVADVELVRHEQNAAAAMAEFTAAAAAPQHAPQWLQHGAPWHSMPPSSPQRCHH